MYCSNCGEAISVKTDHCPKCGVKPFRTKAYCSNCGEKNFNKNLEDCKNCGESLNQNIVSASRVINDSWFDSFQTSLKHLMVKLKRD